MRLIIIIVSEMREMREHIGFFCQNGEHILFILVTQLIKCTPNAPTGPLYSVNHIKALGVHLETLLAYTQQYSAVLTATTKTARLPKEAAVSSKTLLAYTHYSADATLTGTV